MPCDDAGFTSQREIRSFRRNDNMMAVNASSNGYVHATQATYEKSIWSLWRRHYVVGIWHGEASEPLLWVRDHGVTMNLRDGRTLLMSSGGKITRAIP